MGIVKSTKNDPAAKMALKKALGMTNAKTAKVPLQKVKALSKTQQKADAQAKAANEKWERPNLMALCRKLAGCDLVAGVLLFHILYEWRNRDKKLFRHNQEWLAHTRAAWAAAAGLSLDEVAKRALPRLRGYCHEFLDIKANGNGSAKKLWINVDWPMLQEYVSSSQAMPWDMFQAAIDGTGLGYEKGVKEG
jgi:hypothetical protein